MRVLKNYLYNSTFQLLLLILPFITLPYITRVFGSNGVGIYSYTNSIVQYFVLFGTLGVNLYGNREIAYAGNDIKKRSISFWNIFLLKFITTSLSLVIFVIFVNVINTNYYDVLMLQSITIFSALIDISWLFAGLEQFNKIVIRNALVKIIGVVLIFSFVKTPDDLNLYIMINIGTQLIGQLVLWINISKLILKPTFSFELIKKHIKPMIKLFIPQIAIHVFVVLDKTMIGVLSNTSEVGLYDVSMKLIKMSLAVITSLGTVMLPRMSNAISNGETDKVNQYLSKSFRFQTLLAFPLMFGMLGIIENFVPWFFSPDFSGVIILISILSPIYITIAWSNVIGVQLMLPMKEDKKYTISVATGALINFTINLILIPRYGAIGAAIGTLISETAIFMIQFIMMKNFINLRDILEDLWKITISSILMYVIVKMIGILLSSSIITTIIQVLSGIFVYFASLHLIKLRLIIENHLYNELIKKIINFVRRTK